MYIKTNKI